MVAGIPLAAAPPESNEILPLSQVRAGMQGYAYTVFAGEQVEKVGLVVVGVMPNFMGPKQSIILVELKGPKVERRGVVAGMSGSPVHLDGKLAGALSLKLGVFTKEALAGVTPIEDILHPPEQSAGMAPGTGQFALPNTAVAQGGLPNGAALQPIETPLVFSGFQPSALQPFATQLQSFGFVAAQGGTADARPDDGKLAAGENAGIGGVQGGASLKLAGTGAAGGGGKGCFWGASVLCFCGS